MKLKTTLLGYGLIAVISAATLGGIGYWAATKLDHSISGMAESSSDLHAALVADMMHDAIRADIFALTLALQNADTEAVKVAQDDIVEHSKLFNDSIEKVRKSDPSERVASSLKTLSPKLDSYIASAAEMSAIASGKAKMAMENMGKDKKDKPMEVKSSSKNVLSDLNAKRPDFLVAFSDLEKEMGDFDGLVEDENKAIEENSNNMASNSKTSVLIGGVIITILLMLLALVVTRRIMATLGGEPAEVLETAKEIARGNLANHIAVNSGDTTSLLAALNEMQGSLRNLILQIKTSADSIGTGAKEIASGNSDLSSRTEQQASSLEETASSMEELSSTVKQNAENAKQANQLASAASGVAVKGGQVVGEVVGTMSSINESSRKIVDIISVIDGIAFQTNILALNAAVEAARAGEQGRGFAVVAAEVRNLAQRSAAAAKEIKTLIGDSVDKVENGTKLVAQAGETMEEIVNSVKRVTDIMGEIAAASAEQSSGIDQINNAVTQMDEVTQQNAALVEQAAAAAESLEEQAQELTEAVSVFKLDTGSTVSGARRPTPRMATPAPASKPESASVKSVTNTKPKLPKAKAAAEEEWEEF
ncbi:MAG: methyl-accepting chemotaxis protein [Methylophilaceae bacterium]